jgi:hypothetical protein
MFLFYYVNLNNKLMLFVYFINIILCDNDLYINKINYFIQKTDYLLKYPIKSRIIKQ